MTLVAKNAAPVLRVQPEHVRIQLDPAAPLDRQRRHFAARVVASEFLLPHLASAFGIFLLRQAFTMVPKDLEEAARIEGCGVNGIFARTPLLQAL